MSPEQLASVILAAVGVVLSLAFKYIPSLKTWFDGFSHQGLVMLGMCTVVAGLYFVAACIPYLAFLNVPLSCDKAGGFGILQALFIVATGNQLAFLLAPEK